MSIDKVIMFETSQENTKAKSDVSLNDLPRD